MKITVCGDKKGGKISLGLENARVRQALPNTVAAKWEDNQVGAEQGSVQR